MPAKTTRLKHSRISTITSENHEADCNKLKARITDLEKNMVNSQVEFNQIVEYAPSALRIINRDFTIRKINQAFAEMSEVDQDEVVGKNCFDVFPSPFCHTADCRLRHILSGEEKVQTEIDRHKNDGTNIPCIVTTVPLRTADGELAGIIETFKDITESKQLKAEIKETEDRYRALIDLGAESGEAIVMLQDQGDKEGIQVFVNDYWPCITGYAKEELLGTSFFDLTIPEDRQISIDEHRQKISGKSTPGSFEMSIIRKDGVEVFLEINGAFTNYQGKRANVLYARDITARKQTEASLRESEEKYRTIFENVPVAIWEDDYSKVKECIDDLRNQGIKDFVQYFEKEPKAAGEIVNKRRIINFNQALVDFFEANSKDEVTKGISEMLIMPEFKSLLSAQLLHIINGETHFDFNSECLSFQSNKRYIHNRVSIPPCSEKTLSRVYSSVFDLTAIKKAEEEKLQILKNAETSSRLAALGEMAAGIAHEINNPLTSITTFSQLMAIRKDIPGDMQSWVQIIAESSQRMANIIKRLLIFARQEKPDKSPVDLNKVVEDTLELRRYILKISDIEVKTSFDRGLPIIVADPGQLQQVFFNIIVNAEQAMKKAHKKGKLTIATKKQGDHACISFQDDGPGISKENLSRVFEPFFTTKPPGEGVGLGLSLSHSIVLAHGGEISVESELNHGAVFTIQLPITV